MSRTKALRWLVRMVWLAVVVVGYRSSVDFGEQGSTHYNLQMLVMFAIYAAGDALLEWRWPSLRGGDGRRVPGDASTS